MNMINREGSQFQSEQTKKKCDKIVHPPVRGFKTKHGQHEVSHSVKQIYVWNRTVQAKQNEIKTKTPK